LLCSLGVPLRGPLPGTFGSPYRSPRGGELLEGQQGAHEVVCRVREKGQRAEAAGLFVWWMWLALLPQA